MRTKAVRLYGKGDLRLESFDLPALQDGEILARIVSDSICMSSYKAALQGADHKRVPSDVAVRPVVIGHEFCGEILEVTPKWAGQFRPGDRFSIQPALNDPANVHAAPGYTFPYIGGAATHIVIPDIVMSRGCLLRYGGDAFFHGSLAEPMSCIIGGFHVNYHTEPGSYVHKMGILPGGAMALLAGAGPMGLGAVEYAVHHENRPALLVVTDIDAERLARATEVYPPERALDKGVRLVYLDTSGVADVPALLRSFNGGKGFDDVYVYAPVPALVETASALLGFDGCLNFFAGPVDPGFSARFNFYDVHYSATHVAGNSGGNTDDLVESLELMASGAIDPAAMITHIGGLDCVVETTLNLPRIPGGKKLVYTQISLPLTPLAELRTRASEDPMFGPLADIVEGRGGLWSAEAERYLLEHACPIG